METLHLIGQTHHLMQRQSDASGTMTPYCGYGNWDGMGYLEGEKKLNGVGKRRRGRKAKRRGQSEEKKVDKRPAKAQWRGKPGRQTQGTGLRQVQLISFFLLIAFPMS